MVDCSLSSLYNKPIHTLGANMRVTVRNPEHARPHIWLFEQPEFFHYEGEEVRLKHVSSDELALTTGNPEWPVRVIQRRNIVSIDGVDYRQRPINKDILVRKIAGSRGQEYTLTHQAGRWTCTCTGFQYRHTCKHVVTAQA